MTRMNLQLFILLMTASVSTCHNPRDDKKVNQRRTSKETSSVNNKANWLVRRRQEFLQTSKHTLVKRFADDGNNFGRKHHKHPTTIKPNFKRNHGIEAAALRRIGVTLRDSLEKSKPTVETMFRIKLAGGAGAAAAAGRKRQEHLDKSEAAIVENSSSGADRDHWEYLEASLPSSKVPHVNVS